MSAKIAILLGSSRANGNAAGMTAWVTSLFLKAQSSVSASDTTSRPILSIDTIDSHIAPHPLGPVTDPIMSQMIKDPSRYASPRTREWSAYISSTAGIIIVTPQYNWGYPGELKNALDHLYYEWANKPVLLVTYGGRGGNLCAAQLKQVVAGNPPERVGGLEMDYVGEVCVPLPREYIAGDARVGAAGGDEFLKAHDDKLTDALHKLINKAHEYSKGKEVQPDVGEYFMLHLTGLHFDRYYRSRYHLMIVRGPAP